MADGHPDDAYRMDGHKLYWHLDRVEAWMRGEAIAPLHVDMGIATGCNFSCRYCYGMLQGRRGATSGSFMPQEAICRFFSDAKEAGVRSIALIGEGENTLNPALYDVLDHAKSIDLDISLGTNGLELRRDRLEAALSALRWIRFNISAASEAGYRWVHGIDADGFRRVRENIAACVDVKRRLGLDTAIGLQMVLLREGFNEVVPLARLGRELGVDYLVIKPCSDTYDNVLDAPVLEYQAMDAIFAEAESFSGDGYNVVIKRNKLDNKGLKDYAVCHGTSFIIAVSGNGNVFPCGHWFKFRNDEFCMGNIITERFRDILASERYQAVQQRIRTVNVNRDCEMNCRQHYINRFLYKLSNKPPHINFI
jgi:radical SAM protein with 4Fe4S-binding SPASM domain